MCLYRRSETTALVELYLDLSSIRDGRKLAYGGCEPTYSELDGRYTAKRLEDVNTYRTGTGSYVIKAFKSDFVPVHAG